MAGTEAALHNMDQRLGYKIASGKRVGPEFGPDEPIKDEDCPTLPLRTELGEPTTAVAQMLERLGEAEGRMERQLIQGRDFAELVEGKRLSLGYHISWRRSLVPFGRRILRTL